ncbi:MAG: energy transducer TonB, partial [Acidobacteria bacterium]|nr:energy transducer TonB [Acidobacteriota bacterium]
ATADGTSAPKAPVSGGVLNGKAISLPVPVYPEAARTARSSGRVSVEVTVDEQGKVIAARAISGPTLLHRPSVAAAQRARFAPTKLSGQPVKVKGIINYNFNLKP